MREVAYKNKADKAASQRRWYESHRSSQLARVKGNNVRYRKEKRELIRQLKDVPCKDCGQKYPSYVMDFDHVRGQKLENVGTMAGRRWNDGAILEEISKCEVVCANCHRERTHRRKNTAGSASS